MQAEELARIFERSRRGGKAWIARCPSHRDRSPSLSIWNGKDRVMVHCFAGCSKDSILEAVGLTWKDLLYEPRGNLTRVAWLEKQRDKRRQDSRERVIRIAEWLDVHCERGYSAGEYEYDVQCFYALVVLGADKDHRLLKHFAFKILAGIECSKLGWLPKVSRSREWPAIYPDLP